jgi:hypothetical protein
MQPQNSIEITVAFSSITAWFCLHEVHCSPNLLKVCLDLGNILTIYAPMIYTALPARKVFDAHIKNLTRRAV